MAYGTIPTVRISDVPNPLPEDVHVVDVREEAEWQHGHIDGAQHIPLAELPNRVHELPDDGRLLVVCRVGARSAHAVAYLSAGGRDAVNLDGGMVDWAESGRPMVSDTGRDPHVV
jgi:rhodanese-related sulfurtransferase